MPQPKVHDPLKLRTYNAKDCVAQYLLYPRYLQRLEKVPNGRALMALYSDLQLIADKMTFRGVRIDPKDKARHHHALKTRVGTAKADLADIAKQTKFGLLNPDSPPQLRRYFFEHLGATPTKWSDTTEEPSLDESVLSSFLADANPLVAESARKLLKIRRWQTMDRNHVVGLRTDPDNVVHPFWRPGGALTGRWSSSSPNVLNIPKAVREPVLGPDGKQLFYKVTRRLPNGGKIIEGTPRTKLTHSGLRGMYIPFRPSWWVVEADYAQIELRIVALLAGDKPLLDLFARGEDPHSANAWDLFYPADKRPAVVTKAHVTSKERTLAKNFVYLANYGGNAKKLWQTIHPTAPDFTIGKAKKLLEKWFRAHPAIKRWQEATLDKARSTGYVEDVLSGRNRWFWGRVNPNEVYNYPVQSAAGHIINEAIQRVDERLTWRNDGLLFQYHDALMLDGDDPYRLASILQEAMTVSVTLNGQKATFPIDVSVGKRWGTTEEIPDVSELKSRKFLQNLAQETALAM